MRLLIDIDDEDYELINKTGIEIDWNTAWHGKEKDRKMTFAIFNLTEALKNGTPIYEQERPQGEWIDYNNTFYKCPDCGYLLEKCCPQCQKKVILPFGGES